jgi:hypothetical protein
MNYEGEQQGFDFGSGFDGFRLLTIAALTQKGRLMERAIAGTRNHLKPKPQAKTEQEGRMATAFCFDCR